jgi:hypothetical protein
MLVIDWDPIGVRHDVAEVKDEYDRVAARLISMINAGAEVGALADYLVEVETRELGLVARPDRAEAVATAGDGRTAELQAARRWSRRSSRRRSRMLVCPGPAWLTRPDRRPQYFALHPTLRLSVRSSTSETPSSAR